MPSGYCLHKHTVITEDGYILTMHRIPYNKLEAKDKWKQKPVYFLMHDMMGTSASFMNEGTAVRNLAYSLSSAGFDVWMGNARGNPYSRAHQTLDIRKMSDRTDFFNFSWEEIAIFDLPAMIKYILNATGETQMRFLGHSTGATTFLILNILKPEYSSKFLFAQLLDPFGYTKHFPSEQLKAVAGMMDVLHAYAKSVGIEELSTWGLQDSSMVTPDFAIQSLVSYLASVGGFSAMGTSLKHLVHYGRNIRDKAFARWDYGEDLNQKIYGSRSPPLYNISSVNVYTILYCRRTSMLMSELDIRDMASDMPKAHVIIINDTTYAGVEFADVSRLNLWFAATAAAQERDENVQVLVVLTRPEASVLRLGRKQWDYSMEFFKKGVKH